MGYSIVTPFENESTQQQMLIFLNQNFRTLNKLTGKTHYDHVTPPITDVSYDSDEESFVIGFDYNASGLEREYPYLICFWMAMMAGKKKDFDTVKDCPYIIYDGVEEIVLIRSKIAGFHQSQVVDENGFCPIGLEMLTHEERPEADSLNSLVQNELRRLTGLYTERTK